MAEYIEREAIYKTIAKNVEVFDGTGSVIKGQCLEHILTSEPADVVEVVRCKDCIYHNVPPCPMRLSLNWTNDNDFCSYGERRLDNDKSTL